LSLEVRETGISERVKVTPCGIAKKAKTTSSRAKLAVTNSATRPSTVMAAEPWHMHK
jgi:hypothetical protein